MGVVAVGVAQKLPAGHWAHVTLFETAQDSEVYWPETQAPQAEHVAELVAVENVLPETQAVQ